MTHFFCLTYADNSYKVVDFEDENFFDAFAYVLRDFRKEDGFKSIKPIYEKQYITLLNAVPLQPIDEFFYTTDYSNGKRYWSLYTHNINQNNFPDMISDFDNIFYKMYDQREYAKLDDAVPAFREFVKKRIK